ncbi:MAG: hypothetical protein DRI81_13180 [Chloroflexi bacterium]|nr:MAG: hypothetical protein DRI81_13180 [Chloroflexota bacterium]
MKGIKALLLPVCRYSPLLLVAVSVGGGVWYVYAHPAELASVRGLSLGWLALLFCLSAAKIACMGSFTKVIVRSLGIALGFWEGFGLAALSAMGNYLTPFRGGAAVRAVYLKSKHGLSYPLFLSTLSVLYLITLATSAALGVLAMLALHLRFGFVDLALLSFFLALFFLLAAFLVVIKTIPRLPNSSGDQDASAFRRFVWRLMSLADSVIEGWRTISTHRGALLRLLTLSVLNSGVTLLMIHFSFAAFGARLPLVESLVLSSLFMISSMIPLTPSGLGVAEVVLVLASRGFGVGETLGVFSTGLNRTVMVLSSIVWGTLFSYIMGQRVT